MKDSELLQDALTRLGSGEHWCQRTYFRVVDEGPRPLIDEILNRPHIVASMCLDGALQLTARQGWDLRTDFARSPQSQQLHRVRELLTEAFMTQFPELVEQMEAEAEQIRKETWQEFGAAAVVSPLIWEIPLFNDHPAMTYNGVRTVTEKVIAQLQEAGR